MAQFSYDTFKTFNQTKQAGASTTDKNQVGYFSLKNDGDEAIVRFDIASVNDITVATVHTLKRNDRWYKISCTRENGKAPMTDCPLCAKGEKLSTKVYIKLIDYRPDETGKIVPVAKVWERPRQMGDDLAEKLNNYGDLRNYLFKIKRFGVAGSTDTRYTIDLANPSMYNAMSPNYPADFSAFNNFDISKHSYYVRTPEEIEYFMQNSAWPEKKAAEPQVNSATPVAGSTNWSQAPQPSWTQPAPTPVNVQPATPNFTEPAGVIFAQEETTPVEPYPYGRTTQSAAQPQTTQPQEVKPKRYSY